MQIRWIAQAISAAGAPRWLNTPSIVALGRNPGNGADPTSVRGRRCLATRIMRLPPVQQGFLLAGQPSQLSQNLITLVYSLRRQLAIRVEWPFKIRDDLLPGCSGSPDVVIVGRRRETMRSRKHADYDGLARGTRSNVGFSC
jgi:hypothetical protein